MEFLSTGSVIVILLLSCADIDTSEQDVLLPTARPCDLALSVEIVHPHILTNGSLLSEDGYLYPHGDFWIERTVDNEIIYRGCACKSNSCVRKCCPQHHMYAKDAIGKCARRNHSLLQPFKPSFSDVSSDVEYSKIRVLDGDPCTLGKYKLNEGESYVLYGNGTLFIPKQVEESEDLVVENHEYCLEVEEGSNADRISPYLCFPPEEEGPMEPITFESAAMLIYPICMLVSLPFLVATFVVYAIIPELRNLHGKSLMSHVLSLFVGYLFLSIVQLGNGAVLDAYTFCTVSAFIIYFSFLASFFWLNVMCFDLWWTFSGFRPLRGSVRERDHKKFIIYSLYSWGSPLILLSIALIMELANSVPEHVIKPQFGVSSCWFKENSALWAYFYGPVAVILTANLIMFVTTAWKIVQLKRETAVLKGTDSKRHDDDENSQRFSLYLKLFVVMGVNWAMEVISHAVGGPAYLWYITDIGNTLQGILIFIIFVWKDKVRKLLKKRFSGSSAIDSKSGNSTASKSTRVFSSTTNGSVRNMSNQGDLSMAPIPRNENTSKAIP